MPRLDDPTTRPSLLARMRNWGDTEAWRSFADGYQRRIREACRRAGLDRESTDEVEQRVLVLVATRIRVFQYDPSRSFRGWLQRLVERQILSYQRRRAGDQRRLLPLDHIPIELFPPEANGDSVANLSLLRAAEQVLRDVESRVKPTSWTLFWQADVEGRDLARVAEELGLSYYAAYMARRRVREMLAEAARSIPPVASAES